MPREVFVEPVSHHENPRGRVVSNVEDRLRWRVFGAMGASAMVIIVMGIGTQGRTSWDWRYVSYAVIGLRLSSMALTLC